MTGGEAHPPLIGLIADVHSNLQALDAALAWIDGRDVDAIYCLGDVVGYGGDPAACIERVRERCAGTVRGNHDAALADPAFRRWFNRHAREAIERQEGLVGEEAKSWLAELPWTLALGEVTLVHASLADPSDFDYVTGPARAAEALDAQSTRWAFYGHTHVPVAWRRTDDGDTERVSLAAARGDGLALDGPGRYLVNPGAVGQPRDRDPRAACAVFDTATGVLRHARVEYDVEAAQRAVRSAGMPEIEAERLAVGM